MIRSWFSLSSRRAKTFSPANNTSPTGSDITPTFFVFFSLISGSGWLGSRVVSVLDSGAEGPGFKSQPRHYRVTVLGQKIHTHRASVHQAAKLVAALSRVARVTAGLAESNGRLTAKNRDQLRKPTLGNRVWATFTFLIFFK